MLAVGVVTLAAAGTLFPGSARRAEATQNAAAEDKGISAAAAAQIEALAAEKRSRTPAQRKIDTQLLYASKMSRGEPIAAGVQSLAVSVGETERGRVVVDISGTVGDALLQTLEANGARVLAASPAYGSLRAEVALERLESIAASPDVRYIQPKQEAMTSRAERPAAGIGVPVGAGNPASALRPDFAARAARVREKLSSALAAYRNDDSPADGGGGVNSVGARRAEGDVTHRADVARRRYNVDGTGVKIGVLSDGVVNLSFAQASGDLRGSDRAARPGRLRRRGHGDA